MITFEEKSRSRNLTPMEGSAAVVDNQDLIKIEKCSGRKVVIGSFATGSTTKSYT